MEQEAKISGNNVKSIVSFLLFFSRGCQCLDLIESNESMVDEGRIGKNLEGTGGGIIKALSHDFPARTEEFHGRPQRE
jgi:hypothetical protein